MTAFRVLAYGAARSGFLAMLVVVLIEYTAVILGDHRLLTSLSKPVKPSAYTAFVTGVVGAEATFLGLFFTTVGVIAATAYAHVPGEIRRLFVQERSSRTYAKVLVWALVSGIALLGAGALGYTPHALSVEFFALLSIFSVLSLLRLGVDLFNFFDVSALGDPLPRRFGTAAKAAATRSRSPERRADTAGQEAAQVLERYRQLAVLVIHRRGGESRAPIQLSYQLLEMWGTYATLKPSIPTTSPWFALVPSHPNWLALDADQRRLALEFQIMAPGKEALDHLWVERQIGQTLRKLLVETLRGDDWASGIGVVDVAHEHVAQLSTGLHVEEALLLAGEIAGALISAEETPDGGAILPSTLLPMHRVALADRSVVGLIRAWRGFMTGVGRIDADRSGEDLVHALRTRTGPYDVAAPHSLLVVLEKLAAGVDLERRIEGRQVTPEWWVAQTGAQTWRRIVLESARLLLGDVAPLVVARAERYDLKDNPEPLATLIFAGLELIGAISRDLPDIRKALERLAAMSAPIGQGYPWPPDNLDDRVPLGYHNRLLEVLAKVILELPYTGHDPGRPDAFGRAYMTLVGAAFDALLSRDDSLAKLLVDSVFPAAWRALERLYADFAPGSPLEAQVFGTMIVGDLMELSGYALLLHELGSSEVWPRLREHWNGLLGSDPEAWFIEYFTMVIAPQLRAGAVVGAEERRRRREQFNRWLRERGVSMQPSQDQKQNPIVTVFAPVGTDDTNSEPDPNTLFLVEYLLRQPKLRAVPMGDRVDDLRERLARARAADSSDGETQ